MDNRRFIQTFLFCFFFTTLSGVLRKWVFTSTTVGNIIFGLQLLLPLLFFFHCPQGLGPVIFKYGFPPLPLIVDSGGF